MKVSRTWKKDGAVNEMSIDAAVENLRGSAVSPCDKWGEERLREWLVLGNVVETRHAEFKVVME